jgi:hypothetical protein
LDAADAEDEAVVAVVVFLSLSLADLTLNLRPAISFESIAFTAFSISSLFSVSAKAKLKKRKQTHIKSLMFICMKYANPQAKILQFLRLGAHFVFFQHPTHL